MKKTIKIFSVFTILIAGLLSSTFASSFSGYGGGKLNYTTNSKSSVFDPDLTLQAFMAAQFNLTQNSWTRIEAYLDTKDFLYSEKDINNGEVFKSFFSEKEGTFKIDELSFTKRSIQLDRFNYFSAYMGYYDAIGSDIFLQRYLSIESIASKITESWLGLSGSLLYPHYGIGFSDVIAFHDKPVAFGVYGYLNPNADNSYAKNDVGEKSKKVLNFDLRSACSFPYFTGDFAFGMGMPLGNDGNDDYYLQLKTLLWHAGTTMLIGNNYTPSVFIQAGIFNAPLPYADFKNHNFQKLFTTDTYLLIEPRFFVKKRHMDVTIYTLPEDTVKNLLFIEDTFGIDVNFYSNKYSKTGVPYSTGFHTSLSFMDTNLYDLIHTPILFVQTITGLKFNLKITPYYSTTALNGQVHAQVSFNAMDVVNNIVGVVTKTNNVSHWYNALSADIGYKKNF